MKLAFNFFFFSGPIPINVQKNKKVWKWINGLGTVLTIKSTLRERGELTGEGNVRRAKLEEPIPIALEGLSEASMGGSPSCPFAVMPSAV